MKTLPPDVLEYFRQQGKKGGSIGGKTAAKNMTAAARVKRARMAGEASAAARKRKAKAKKPG
jgi:hypothetical protein